MSSYSRRRGCVTYRCTIYGRAHMGSVCAFCNKPSERLCDGPTWSGEPGTCDATICADCAKRTGADHDLCPDCMEGRRS